MTNAENIRIEESTCVPHAEVIALYEANEWSAAKKPVELCKALANSDSLVLAWDGNELVGLGNAISDGHLVVYFPHLLVHPLHHRRGIGRMILERLKHQFGILNGKE